MNLKRIQLLDHKYGVPLSVGILAMLVSLVTRIVLLTAFRKDMDISLLSLPGIFMAGTLYDLITALFIALPFVLQITFTNDFIYTRNGRWITMVSFLALLCLLLFTSIVPKDFSKELYKGVIVYLVIRLGIFMFLCTQKPAFRCKWRKAVLQVFMFLAIVLIVFNGISEFVFWNEFSSRYNFIAVDYLIYTNEVIGNIRESYHLYWILALVLAASLAIFALIRRAARFSVRASMRFFKRMAVLLLVLACCMISVFLIRPEWKDISRNNYANELAGNGVYQFVQAFKNNELDFYKYYRTLSDSVAFSIVRDQLNVSNAPFINNDVFDFRRHVSYPLPERKLNVVLITVESLSACFMSSFGNTHGITPQLDSLAARGMLFTNLYASGTRTVRGLEALSLSLPPTPGESIVKRPGNEQLFSLGSIFKRKGYITQYIYGGYSYFDNMNYFFSHNDYEVIDRSSLQPNEIHYANIWGVADEDLFTLSLRTMDHDYRSGKPFFAHVMTVSNHRPYTYPDGRINIPSSDQSRDGAVKYTDYAIADFIKRAAKKPWFNNTIFVIVADHCASSAGRVAMPVTGYHIPMIIYSPQYILPQKVERLTAQIDIPPIILGLLRFNYASRFFGQDVLNIPAGKERAFISTYQGLGYLKNGELVINAPVRQLNSYRPNFTTGENTPDNLNDSIGKQAISYYQAAAWLLKNKRFGSKGPS